LERDTRFRGALFYVSRFKCVFTAILSILEAVFIGINCDSFALDEF
jgi:hypothetical protein